MTWEEPDGEREGLSPPVRYAPIRADGWVRFVALPPGREFEMLAAAEINRHVWARGLKPGQSEQRIEREDVKDIAGKVRGRRRGGITVDVYVHPGRGRVFPTPYRARTGGERRLLPRSRPPPGTYLVNVGSHAGEVWSVSTIIEAGTTDAIVRID